MPERVKSGRYSITVRDRQVIALADWRVIDIMASANILTGEQYRVADELFALYEASKLLPGIVAAPLERVGGAPEHDPNEAAGRKLRSLLAVLLPDQRTVIWQVVLQGGGLPMPDERMDDLRDGLDALANKV